MAVTPALYQQQLNQLNKFSNINPRERTYRDLIQLRELYNEIKYGEEIPIKTKYFKGNPEKILPVDIVTLMIRSEKRKNAMLKRKNAMLKRK